MVSAVFAAMDFGLLCYDFCSVWIFEIEIDVHHNIIDKLDEAPPQRQPKSLQCLPIEEKRLIKRPFIPKTLTQPDLVKKFEKSC